MLLVDIHQHIVSKHILRPILILTHTHYIKAYLSYYFSVSREPNFALLVSLYKNQILDRNFAFFSPVLETTQGLLLANAQTTDSTVSLFFSCRLEAPDSPTSVFLQTLTGHFPLTMVQLDDYIKYWIKCAIFCVQRGT